MSRNREIRNPEIGTPIPHTIQDTKQDNIIYAQTDSKLSASHRKDQISFCYSNRRFVGIDDRDRSAWSQAYPSIDLMREIARAQEWLIANPTKAKKQWRRFLTGWLQRANDHAENKKAYASAQATHIDRRTLDRNGKPYESEDTRW